jgi:hypothetical protein
MSIPLALNHGLLNAPSTSAVRWRRVALGNVLLLHGLAHSNVIIWASNSGPFWLIALLWTVSVLGYLSAGLGVLGVPLVRQVWAWTLAAATLSSLVLLALAATSLSSLGIFLDLLYIPGAVRWGPLADTPATRHPVRFSLALLALAWATIVVLWRPIYVQWGTTPDERHMVLPGDNTTVESRYRVDHAVTIQAPVDSVWPWLVQIGQDRGGFYSYDWLERLVGDDIHNADRIHPEWQQLKVGDLVRAAQPSYLGGRLGPDLGWRVTEIVPGRAIVLEQWGAFVLRPVNPVTTRLHIRSRGEGTASVASMLLGPVNIFVFEPAHFIMQRRMMLGIRERAEPMMR